MNQEIIKKLVTELITSDQMLVVIDSGGAVSEMHVRDMPAPEYKGQWATIESQDWHVHLNMATVDGVQFVENSDQTHDVMPKLFYVRLSSGDGVTLIRFYFPNPWLDDDESPTEFQPERLQYFEDFRDRYVGTDGIVFVRRGGGKDRYFADVAGIAAEV
ncbi:MAG: hypothetical protein BZY79_05460 [SAR202 cluster bacterium Casp-Chloro-G4]|nr:hypothetical protein [Chloroflexota bacterium]MDA1226969.1 hypothetical protein [Chloroflexota bacterium]PKB61114.1 MAG: hypothetical protein BZY79_05460 [SAR202 cluster bacterium Casp-Chloro-G4]